MNGVKPIINPSQKYFEVKIYFFLIRYGSNDVIGIATRKVFIIKAKPIQSPKRDMKTNSFSLFVYTIENIPKVTKQLYIKS